MARSARGIAAAVGLEAVDIVLYSALHNAVANRDVDGFLGTIGLDVRNLWHAIRSLPAARG